MSDLTTSGGTRKTGLVVCGILAVVLGVFCVALAPLILFSQMALALQQGPESANYQAVIPGALMYAVFGVILGWLGVGSVLGRRWARALLLILSWSVLIMGVVGIGVTAVMLPQVMQSSMAVEGGPELSGVMMWVVVLIPLVFMGFFVVLTPLGGVLFYGSRSVKETCERLDPVERWTDRCPLPLLALSLWAIFFSGSMAVVALVSPVVVPFFGMFLTGGIGVGVILLVAVALAWSGWACYRRNVTGWWFLVVLSGLYTVSHVLTFLRHGVMEMYELMEIPEAQMEVLRKYDAIPESFMTWSVLLWTIPALGYLWWARRFFRKPMA